MIALATPAECAHDLTVADAAAHLGYEHHDTVRKRARPSWAGTGHRIHGHHSAGGGEGGQWRFKTRVLDVWFAGGDYAAQLVACGPDCPEAPSAAARARATAATRRH